MKRLVHFTRTRHHQRGIVALEFALMFTFGLLPLLLLTFAGVLTFSAQQALTLAAADGARAALRYPAVTSSALKAREDTAKAVASNRMDWLLAATGHPDDAITAASDKCPRQPEITCITVTTRTLCQDSSTAFCWWMLIDNLDSHATVQLPDAVEGTPP